MFVNRKQARALRIAQSTQRLHLLPLFLGMMLLAACGDDGESRAVPTATAIPTGTSTRVFTPSDTPTERPSATATATRSNTPPATPTGTATHTVIPTDSPTATPTGTATEIPTATATAVPVCAPRNDGEVSATFQIRPGVEGVTVSGAPPSTQLNLYDSEGNALVGLITDDLGQAHFAYIPDEFFVIQTGPDMVIPTDQGGTLQRGSCYVIRNVESDAIEASEPFSVLGVDDVPPPSFFDSRELVEDW